ncbi:MAG: secretin N-terminal domain-containing protein [Opitutales bacterium]
MKSQKLIPLFSIFFMVPLYAQQAQVESLDRAEKTITAADATYDARESEVLGESRQAPSLPEEPVFEVPSDQVFLDLPGDEAASSAVAVDAETISVDFPEEDVRTIIRSVAELYELNVVIPDSLAGSVSIKLRDVTWQQVFNVVLEPMNYTYVVDGNIIKIKSQDELAVEPVDTRVFIVDFAKAGEIRASIMPLIDEGNGGKVQVDTRSNSLVITERPSRMNDIQEIIETLDRPTEQVMIESKFVEIEDRQGAGKGINWQSLAGYGLQAGPVQRDFLRHKSRNLDADRDNPNRVQYDYQSDLLYEGDEDIGSFTGDADWWTNEVGRMDTAVFSADAFSMVISALDSTSDVELVSNPTVVTMNNSPARINIGEEYPIPAYTYNDERGTFEVSNFEYKNIGINLEVTPQINSAGFINLDIRPEISSRSGVVQFGGGGGATASIPIISTRKTVSKVTIKSGFTLAIGGLMENATELNDTSVPILGDIPYVGRLFSSESKSIRKRNLIVFITAKILSASGATYEDVFTNQDLYEMGVSPRDVPGFTPSDEEMKMYDDVLKGRDQVDQLQRELEIRQQMQLLEEARQSGVLNMDLQGEKEVESQQLPKRKFQG